MKKKVRKNRVRWKRNLGSISQRSFMARMEDYRKKEKRNKMKVKVKMKRNQRFISRKLDLEEVLLRLDIE